jgi:two-component system sensor kinase FixL
MFHMPDRRQEERRAITSGPRTTWFFAAVITVMVILMLAWHARVRIDDFNAQHRLLGEQSVMATASAISMFISEMRRSIDLFVDERRSDLEQLVAHPDDEEAHEVFRNRIRKHFPEFTEFAYTDADGNKLSGGPEIPVGSRCRTTIQDFVSFDGLNELELHAGMQMPSMHESDMDYHFDVMSLHTSSTSGDAVFFLSFETSELSQILSRSEVAGHRLFLIRQEEPPLIDITSEGDLTLLMRSPVLEPDELVHTNYSMPVPGTRWQLVELSEAKLISGAYTSIWTQTAGIIAGFIAVIIVMFLMIAREERRRSVAEDALLSEHDVLEKRVDDRTEELVVANSALMQSEQRYRDLFENTSDLIQSAGPDGKLLYVNQAWRKTLGYSEQEVAEINIFNIIHPDSMDHCRKMFKDLISGKTTQNTEITLVAKDGHVVVVEGSTSCKFHNGKPVATRGMYRDITEQKNAEKQANMRRKELARMMRLSTMGEMASALAHELNQPLTSISNYAKGSLARLKRDPDELEPIIGALEKIADDAGRTGDFIRNWADFLSRGELERSPENLNQIINKAVSHVDTELQQAGVDLVLDLDDDLPQVFISAIAIELVIVNLLRNSLESITSLDSGDGRITIRTSHTDKQSVFIEVEDSGAGIPDDVLEKIFDPFCTTKESGMGLGLAICRSIIVAYEGKIRAENLSQGGAIFHITIPLN